MFSFLLTQGEKIDEQFVAQMEKDFGFEFPDIIKSFYINHHEAEIIEMQLIINDYEFEIVRLLSIETLRMLLEENKKYHTPNTIIPFASDWGDNLFGWDKNDGKVYISFIDSDEPLYITESIERFFELLKPSDYYS